MTSRKRKKKPLIDRIKRQIALEGPLGISEYMALCLGDPEAGYYTNGKPFGRDGDFITAPEISQMFGEMIGVWCVLMWRNMGKPSKFNLVELGPGRGTLMADLLRAAKVDEGFCKAVHVKLVEISKPLRKKQATALKNFDGNLRWLDDIQGVSAQPAIFIGNEFLDALPLRQYKKSGKHWLEQVVGVADEKLCFFNGQGCFDPKDLPENYDEEPDGSVFEMSPAREAIVQYISEHIGGFSGAALLIDYGHTERGFGDTFQAVSKHKFVNPLKSPGKADLTSHVDFSAFTKYFDERVNYRLTTQAEFLSSLGLVERAGALGHGKSSEERYDIEMAVERLAGRNAMGELFKVLVAASKEFRLIGG